MDSGVGTRQSNARVFSTDIVFDCSDGLGHVEIYAFTRKWQGSKVGGGTEEEGAGWL